MVDPVTVQILRNKVAGLVEEMHYHFYRSGYSTIIRESRDFSCVIVDAAGGLIVAPPMFFHAPVYKHLVGRILEIYGADGLADGDMFVCNHPYEGGLPHVSDMAFVAPIFADDALIGFAGSIAHKADIGGTNPGSTSANATEIYHEGLLLPPIRIAEAGRYKDDLERLILTNSRQPELVRGDMRAQIAATRLGVERIRDICGRFGGDTVREAFAAILAGAASALKAAIGALPTGPRRPKASWIPTGSSATARSASPAPSRSRARPRPSISATPTARRRVRSTSAPRWSRRAASTP